jgi:hypothetical protein
MNHADKNICRDSECSYGMKKHYHVNTSNGSYVRFIVEKPKEIVDRSNDHADTRR